MLDAGEENIESDDWSAEEDSVSSRSSSEYASESSESTATDVDELDVGLEGPVEASPSLSMFDDGED